MKLLIRIAVAVAISIAGIIITLYVLSERRLTATYDVPAGALDLPDDGASVARGEHLVRSVGSCTLCHGDDLGGAVYADMGPIGVVAGPNLTTGDGGIGRSFQREDWVRAIRYGIRRDGTSLIMMPSEVFTNFSNADLASIVARPVCRRRPISRRPVSARGRPMTSRERCGPAVGPTAVRSTSSCPGVSSPG